MKTLSFDLPGVVMLGLKISCDQINPLCMFFFPAAIWIMRNSAEEKPFDYKSLKIFQSAYHTCQKVKVLINSC